MVARPTFRVIASMNPYDNVGTTRLSTSVHDRMCRLAISYQDAAAERGIVVLRAPLPELPDALGDRLIGDAVALTRATREHQDIRQGSSVRGAIDLTLVAGQLLELADLTGGTPGQYAGQYPGRHGGVPCQLTPPGSSMTSATSAMTAAGSAGPRSSAP